MLSYDYEEAAQKLSNLNITSDEFEIARPENIISTKIPICTITSLSKIQNISPSGTKLKIYVTMDGDKPIKIVSPIHNYGIVKIYILKNDD